MIGVHQGRRRGGVSPAGAGIAALCARLDGARGGGAGVAGGGGRVIAAPVFSPKLRAVCSREKMPAS
jgi:hypothetical protein